MSAPARHRDAALASILDGLGTALAGTCLTGTRGGLVRGVGWAACAGRADDGSWVELKLRHHPTETRLDAGVLAYVPMRDGGGTRVVDECSWRYLEAPGEVTRAVVDGVGAWLAPLKRGRP